jgi:cyclophilin family peptidyl-prolyl cis-trans isomerase/HEAT repeat protein
MGLRRRTFLLLWICVGSFGCGRHKLDAGELERNRLFAEILEREDRRALGEDEFFPENLQSSPHPEVGEWCAIALGRIGNPQALPWLYKAFDSPYASVRAAAAFAVGEIEDREILKVEFRPADARTIVELVDLLDDSALPVRMRAVEALGKVGSVSEASEIARRLDSFSSPQQRAFLSLAVTALMRLKDPGALPILEKLAGEGDPEIQWRVANALYRMQAKSSRDTFVRLLKSHNSDVRAHAARGVGVCAEPGLADLLFPFLPPKDSDGKVIPLSERVCAVQSVGNLKNPGAIPAIRAALEAAPITSDNPDQWNFAIQAATALGNIGSPEGEPVLTRLLNIQGAVAHQAVIGLAKVYKGSPDKVETPRWGVSFFDLAKSSRFTTPEGKRAWAQALGELGGEQAIRELKSLLIGTADGEDSVDLVLPAVLRGLTTAGAPDLQALLLPFLASRDGVVLQTAIQGYKPGEGDPKPWAPLVAAYTGIAAGKEIEAKVEALNALEPWLREKEVESILRAALNDRQRNVRIAAARLLRKAGATDIPVDPGPSESVTTKTTYNILAGSRNERTVAVLETTRGRIEIELFRQDAPLTVANFVALVKRSYFDGLSFMRVVPYFVIQGGDPRNDMEGGPGYTIRCEINMRPYEKGSVGMALSGKDTGGSQFFITLSPQPHLDGGYTCFGRVISGMRSVENMIAGDRIVKAWIVEEKTLFDYRR